MRRSLALIALALLASMRMGYCLPDPDRRVCAEIADFCVTQVPQLRDHAAHWFIAIDVSGSMPPRHEPLTRVLDTFIEYVMVPGDQVSEILFDDQIRAIPGDTVITYAATLPVLPVETNRGELKHAMLSEIRVRRGRPGGTAVDDAWEQLFLGAEKAESATPRVLPVLLELSDRTNTEELQRRDNHMTQLERRFAGAFGSGANGTKLQSLKRIDLECVKGQKDLWVRLSVARNTAAYPATGVSRKKPLAEPIVSPEPQDVWENARTLAHVGSMALFCIGGFLLFQAYRSPVGHLRSDTLRRALDLRYHERPQLIAASRNEVSAFHIAPERAGLPDPPVFEVRPEHTRGLQWQAVLSSRPGYHFSDPYGVPITTLTLSPSTHTEVKVTDTSGLVARDQYRWELSSRFSRLVISGVALILMGTALYASAPHLFAPPAPPPPPIRVVPL